MPVSITLAGQDYNHSPVDQQFTAAAGAARWKSRAESGESKSPGWYLAANGPAAQRAWPRAMPQSGKTSMRLEHDPSVELKGQRVSM